MEDRYTEVEGYSFCLKTITPFEEWVSDYSKFLQLGRRDKEKVFLRWKWGFTDERANEELDLSERQVLYRFKDSDLSELNKGSRFHIEQKRQFDRVCYETKKRIGLIQEKNPLVDKIMDTFDAKEY